MTSKQYIKNHLQTIIDKYIAQQRCDHEWEEYGHGYNCHKCDKYTGLNKKLNDIIKSELDRNKKLKKILNGLP